MKSLWFQCKKPDQKIKPYLKANLPKRFHFANSRRIEDVNILVDPEWLFERYPSSIFLFCFLFAVVAWSFTTFARATIRGQLAMTQEDRRECSISVHMG